MTRTSHKSFAPMRRLAALVPLMAVALAAVQVATPAPAYAVDAPLCEVKSVANGVETSLGYFSYIDNALAEASSATGDEVVISFMRDLKLSHKIEVPAGKAWTFDLNGHMIDRGNGNTDYYGTGDGQVFYVNEGATLTVNGGSDSASASTTHAGHIVNCKVGTFWMQGTDASCVSLDIKGGLITGGACDDSDGAGAISLVGEGTKLYLNDVTLAGNIADEYNSSYGDGGAIGAFGKNEEVTLSNTTVEYNHAEDQGGAIYVESNGTKLTLTNGTKLYANSASGHGGAVYFNANDGEISLADGSEICKNESKKSGGGIYHNGKAGSVSLSGASKINENVAGDDGGGIYDYYDGTSFTLADGSTISKNDCGDNDGGGLYLNDVASLTLTGGSAVSDNKAGGGAGAYVADNGSSISLTDSSMNGNTCLEGSDSYAGGALYLHHGCTITMENSQMDGNSATHGGAIASLSAEAVSISLTKGSHLNSNTAYWTGGAIYFDVNTITVSSEDKTGSISNNKAGTKSENGRGGALYSALSTRKDGIALRGLTISGNYAKGGGAIYVYEDAADHPLRLTNCTLTGNSAEYGGAINFVADVYLTNTTIQGNTATAGGGGVFVRGKFKTYDEYLFISGTVVIDGNTVNGKRNNVEQEDSSFYGQSPFFSCINENSCPSAESHIGVTIGGYDGSAPKKLTTMKIFTTNFSENPGKVLFSDDNNYSVGYSGDDGYLYLLNQKSCWTITSSFGDGQTSSAERDENDHIELSTSDFPKVGYAVDYLTVSGLGSTTKLKPDTDGRFSFYMPPNDVTLTAHYIPLATSVSFAFDEDCAWGDLSSAASSSRVYATGFEATDSEGSTYAISFEDDEPVTLRRVSVVDVTEEDGTAVKNVTYTVEIAASVLDAWGVTAEGSSLSSGVVRASAFCGEVAASATSVGVSESGAVTLTATLTYAEPPAEYKTVTVNATNANGGSLGSTSVQVEAGADASIAVPEKTGMSFVSWGDLPEGATVDEDGSVTIPAIADDVTLTASYVPVVSSVAVTVADPVVGEALPTAPISCKVTSPAEVDVTSAAAANVSWAKASDPSTVLAAGAEAEGNTTYVATVTMALGGGSGYQFAWAGDVAASVNGASAGKATVDAAAGTQTISYTVTTGADTRVDHVATDISDATITQPDDYEASLPSSIVLVLKDGSTEFAEVSWDTTGVDPALQSGDFVVTGTYSFAGQTYEVTRTFHLVELDEPVASVVAGAYSETQQVDLSAGTNWGSADATIYYYLVRAGESADNVTPDQFVAYDGNPITIDSNAILLSYAKVGERTTSVSKLSYTIERGYAITVEDGTAIDTDGNALSSAQYGAVVRLVAGTAPAGKEFAGWEVVSGGAEIADASAEQTTFVMPSSDVSVRATWADKQSGGDSGDSGDKGDSGSDKGDGDKGDSGSGDKGDGSDSGSDGGDSGSGDKGDSGSDKGDGDKGDSGSDKGDGDKGDSGSGDRGDGGDSGDKGDSGSDSGDKDDSGSDKDDGDKGDSDDKGGAAGKTDQDSNDSGKGASSEGPSSSEKAEPIIPATGDTNSYVVPIVLAVVGVAVVIAGIVLVVKGRR